MSSPTITLIQQAITSILQPSFLDVKDDREEHLGHAHQDSGHFTVTIAADALIGKKPIEQHRMIYAALGDLMQTHIHALRIQIK